MHPKVKRGMFIFREGAQMLSERVFPPAGECKEHLSGYDLTTNLIRGGISKLELTPNTKLVLLYLSTCYNERKGVVFPKIKTISEALGISEISVKRAISELIKAGCVFKAKRYKNSNQYVITQKVTSTAQNDTSEQYQNDTSHIHEVKEHEIKEQHVKVVSLKKSFNQELPEQIKEYLTFKGIKNPAGYWNTALKGGYADDLQTKAKEHQEAEQRKERLRQEREQAELRERAKKQKMLQDISRPLTEQWTKEQAIKTIYSMRKLIRHGSVGLAHDLADAFNLDINEIIAGKYNV